MQHLFVEYPLALKLKEAGFEEPCLGNWYEGRLYPWLTHASAFIKLHPGIQSTMHSFEGYKPQDVVFANNTPNNPDYTAAPIYQQVFDWLEGKGFDLRFPRAVIDNGKFYDIEIFEHCTNILRFALYKTNESLCETKKQAWDRAIEEALKILKEKGDAL